MKDRTLNVSLDETSLVSDCEEDDDDDYRFGVSNFVFLCRDMPAQGAPWKDEIERMEYLTQTDSSALPTAREDTSLKPNGQRNEFHRVQLVKEDGSSRTSQSGNDIIETSYPSSADQEILTGFEDCMNEAIRYLLEVELLPVDHPLVQGLRVHLLEQKRKLVNDLVSVENSVLANETSQSAVNLGQDLRISPSITESPTPPAFYSEEDLSSSGPQSPPLSPLSMDSCLSEISYQTHENLEDTGSGSLDFPSEGFLANGQKPALQ